MNILHYSLGFPPYRSGGLTEYAVDLAKEQRKQGHTVSMLWPGRLTKNDRSGISKRRDFCGIANYELINPLPVPLIYGISDTALYTAHRNKDIFIAFLKTVNPSVIHLHTLMGLPKEFLLAAKELNIKTIFTSHDYFGICPKVNLFYNGQNCDGKNLQDCFRCNQNALSLGKIRIMQSAFYRFLKDKPVMRYIKRKSKQSIQASPEIYKDTSPHVNEEEKAQKYTELRNFYLDMFRLIDLYLFNSAQTEQVYRNFIDPLNGFAVPILHAYIKDNRRIRQFGKKLRLLYLGPASAHKGYHLLIHTVNEMFEEGYTDIELHLYNKSGDESPFIIHHEPYNIADMANVFDNIDLLVVPSLWKETFGFVVLEALSFGVPVLATSNVGAKDLIKEDEGFVVKSDKEAIKDALIAVYKERSILANFNRTIVQDKTKIFDFEQHVRQIVGLYERG